MENIYNQTITNMVSGKCGVMMKQNHLIFILTFMILALLGVAGCQGEQDTAVFTLSLSPTTSPTDTVTITKTPTKRPTRTPKPTKTITLTPFFTTNPKDFDVSTIVTITPAEPAQCPMIDPDMIFDGQQILDIYAVDPEMDTFNKQREEFAIFINYLNQGGSFQSLIEGLNNTFDLDYGTIYFYEDVTGDGINEVIFPMHENVYVYACKNEQYSLIDNFSTDFGAYTPRVRVMDLNNNGLLEIIMDYSGCLGGKCFSINVYEFDGNQFRDLFDWHCNEDISLPDSFSINDIDNNNTIEIILKYGKHYIPVYPEDYPFRDETMICMWNGNSYVPAENIFSSPSYLFQAVQDGDRQMLYEYYDQALLFYKQAIHDKTLDWMSIERRILDYEIYTFEHYGANAPNPTATPVLFENPDEYPILASYSYFRIALIYLLLGDLDLAQITFDEQKTTFPVEQIGGEFTEITDILIQSYLNTENISVSCNAVNDAVSKRSNQFSNYSNYFNYTSRFYQPSNLCPY